jgi:hypothetical protein
VAVVATLVASDAAGNSSTRTANLKLKLPRRR